MDIEPKPFANVPHVRQSEPGKVEFLEWLNFTFEVAMVELLMLVVVPLLLFIVSLVLVWNFHYVGALVAAIFAAIFFHVFCNIFNGYGNPTSRVTKIRQVTLFKEDLVVCGFTFLILSVITFGLKNVL